MKESIKESMEVLQGVEKIALDVYEAKADDGVISLFEQMKLAIQNAPTAVQMAIDAKKIPAEMADLDSAEAKELGEQAVKTSNAIVKLFGAF